MTCEIDVWLVKALAVKGLEPFLNLQRHVADIRCGQRLERKGQSLENAFLVSDCQGTWWAMVGGNDGVSVTE